MLTQENFGESVIAQDDDNDYSESGWVAIIHEGIAYLAQYGHCSCYGTWTALTGGSYSSGALDLPSNWYVWTGTPKELFDMADRSADPAMPERVSEDKDCDYDHLMAVYDQIKKLDMSKYCPEMFV